jgi:hypothetical protein
MPRMPASRKSFIGENAPTAPAEMTTPPLSLAHDARLSHGAVEIFPFWKSKTAIFCLNSSSVIRVA